MKKTMRDMFDLTTADEIENLVSQNKAPEIAEQDLSNMKSRVYTKTGLKQPPKKKGLWLGWQTAAVAACLFVAAGVMLLFGSGILNFDSVSDLSIDETQENGGVDQNEDNQQNNDTHVNIPGDKPGGTDENTNNGGSDDDIVQSKVISEQGTLTMTIVKTRPSCPAFEKNCFYAEDESGRVCRVIWSEFEGLSEEDRVVVQYRDLKELTYKEYSSGWTPPYELTAVSVQLVGTSNHKKAPEIQVKQSNITATVGETFDILEYIEVTGYNDIYFESMSPVSISIDDFGSVTVNAAVVAEIYIVAENEAGSTKVIIEVQGTEKSVVPGLLLNAAEARLEIGQTYNLYKKIYTSASELWFESEDESIAAVDENGLITAKNSGHTSVRIYVVAEDEKHLRGTFEVFVKTSWTPTDAIEEEIVDALGNLTQFETFHWYKVNITSRPEYNMNDEQNTSPGPVEIWQDTLQLYLRFQRDEVDATIGWKDQATYNFYFDFYYCPYDDYQKVGEYKKATLQAWSVYDDPKEPIYRCKFYDAFEMATDPLVEGQLYDVVIVVRQGDTALGYAQSEFVWTDSSRIFTEYAEAHPEIIK